MKEVPSIYKEKKLLHQPHPYQFDKFANIWLIFNNIMHRIRSTIFVTSQDHYVVVMDFACSCRTYGLCLF